jgi:protein gp37
MANHEESLQKPKKRSNDNRPADWNPWHGCTKISPGCLHCYMYRTDAKHDRDSSIVTKTSTFNLPIQKKKDGSWKVKPGNLVWTCFTSDFFHKDADVWREEAWDMIRLRSDLHFFFITKRIDRFMDCIPSDWGSGWPNVEIACTCENQDRANYRLPIYAEVPIKKKTIICEPLLEDIDLSKWLCLRKENEDGRVVRVFHQVVVGGESGLEARVCNYDWVLHIREQCMKTGTAFTFKQTGAHFEKDGHLYNLQRKLHHAQAKKANINYSGDKSTAVDLKSSFRASNKNDVQKDAVSDNQLMLDF